MDAVPASGRSHRRPRNGVDHQADGQHDADDQRLTLGKAHCHGGVLDLLETGKLAHDIMRARQIEGESDVGKGTTFKIFLPRSHGQPAEEGRPASTLPRGNERILVVEDNDAMREAVVQQLGSLGYQVSSAAGGLEGLAQIRKGQHYDLLLADVVMPPPMTGKDFADEARRLLPDMRVVFMSGFAETTTIGTGLPASETRLLAKPFRKADVAHAVRQALDDAS